MEETLVATKTKAFLELKHGYCSQDGKDLIFLSSNSKYWTIGNLTIGIHFLILFSPWNAQY